PAQPPRQGAGRVVGSSDLTWNAHESTSFAKGVSANPLCEGLAEALSGLEHDFDAAVVLVTERLVHFRPLLEADAVGDDEGRIDLPFLNAFEQVIGPAIDVGLAHAEGQALVHRRAEGNLVDKSAI